MIADKYFNNDITKIQSLFNSKGYKFFSQGYFNLNLFGIRSNNSVSDKFDDVFYVVYKDPQSLNIGKWLIHCFPCTTDPGKHWLLNPMNVKGCAIVVPGQYRALWSLGKHNGKYEALVQTGLINIIRDNNTDTILNFELMIFEKNIFKNQKGLGINCHRADSLKTLLNVNMYSAGCQVIQDPKDFDILIQLCHKQNIQYNTNSFSYTLFTEKELN